jgi:hypothetical protein
MENKIKVKELVRYLDLHGGKLPELTWKQRLLIAIYDKNNIFAIRQRACQYYQQNIKGPNHRRNHSV